MNFLAKVIILIGLLATKCDSSGNEQDDSKVDVMRYPEQQNVKKYRKFIGQRNYHVPLRTRFAQPLRDGHIIHAVGILNSDPKRVDFNFQKETEKNADIPLHISFRIDEGKLVYNTFVNGVWSDNEQRIKVPLQADSEIDLRIRIINGKYQVFVNRVEIGSFDQQKSIDGVDKVTVTGDLTELKLLRYGGQIFDIPVNLNVKLEPGMRFDATLYPTGNRFNLNFYRHDHQYALQISVRFNEVAIVRNAMTNHVWGHEEREGGLPFGKGEIVDVTVINEQTGFLIFINGNHFTTFSHRGPPNDIERIGIDGEVQIFSAMTFIESSVS